MPEAGSVALGTLSPLSSRESDSAPLVLVPPSEASHREEAEETFEEDRGPASRPSGTVAKGPLELDVLSGYRALARDRAGFVEFCRESDARVRELLAGDLSELRIRTALRTLTARAALLEIVGLSGIAHRLERTFVDARRLPSAEEVEELGDYWRLWLDAILGDLDDTREEMVELEYMAFEGVLDRLRSGDEPGLIAKELEQLRNEAVEHRFRHLRSQIAHLTRRYAREDIEVELRGADVRVPRERFAGIWGTLVHAVENALEHGIESVAERRAQGKSGPGKLSVRARMEANACVLEIADDGRGVDWKEISTRARAQRMPHVTREDLVEVLFSPGFSTREAPREDSGYGFGLLAVREACHELHGSVLLISSPGRGTTVRISVPMRGSEIPFLRSTAPGPRSLRAPLVTRIEQKRTIAQ